MSMGATPTEDSSTVDLAIAATITSKDSFQDEDATDRDSPAADEPDQDEQARKVAEKDTLSVRIWRFVVTDVMIMVTCTVLLTAYAVLRDGEYREFEDAFFHASEALSSALEFEYKADINAIIGLAHALDPQRDNPNANSSFHQPPTFQSMAQQFQKLSTVETFYYAPLVPQADQNEYLAGVDQFVATETSGSWQGYHPYFTHFDLSLQAFIRAPTQEYYFPTLVSYPPDPSHLVLNWNLADLALHSFSPPDSTTSDLLDALALVEPDQAFMIPPEPMLNRISDLYSYVMAPVLQRARSDQTQRIVGIVVGARSIQTKILQALEEHSQGLVIVFKHSPQCFLNHWDHLTTSTPNSDELDAVTTYTFRVDGPNSTTLLGHGDLHDPVYDDLQLMLDLPTGILAGECVKEISIYPSRSLELHYRTPFPESFTFLLTVAFIAVAASFFRYDCLVDRRNDKLIDKFVRSNAIVSSLFPKMYHDRLMGEAQQQDQHDDTSKRRSHMSQHGDDSSKNANTNDKNNAASKPLADIFEDVTILFADIAGFTAWSSAREPYQVFRLLETLYSHFDECAEKRRVFKVETIGDCYVAATGLPQPRKDHAKAMVRFARDIMHQMAVLTRQLKAELGSDTENLALRAGLHSGAVTAGILRGQKARFQLFGDAMNTASRVESNGLPGKIQVSQTTADLIIAGGNQNWLEKRPDKISAKGKGFMQTYWVKTGIKGRDDHSADGYEMCAQSDVDDDDSNFSLNSRQTLLASHMDQIISTRQMEKVRTKQDSQCTTEISTQ